MSVKNIIPDAKDIRGIIPEVTVSHDSGIQSNGDLVEKNCWANLPLELLMDVLERVESDQAAWPARKDVVACAGVCQSWREIMKELVKPPEDTGNITFPIALKQPGPRDAQVQCFIKRDRANSTFYLYLGLSPSLMVENSKFLLAARRVRRATCTDYLISLDADDMSRAGNNYVGKLRSNFLGTKFTVHDCQPPVNGAVVSSSRTSRRISSKQVSPRLSACSYNVAQIGYELNVLGARGPRRMQCTLHSIPASAMERGGKAPTPSDLPAFADHSLAPSPISRANSGISSPEVASISKAENKISDPLMLKNKAPRWHEQLQCWCLNFKGRVTVASVKNFQLVAALDPSPLVPQSELDKVLLQFGKIGKDTFTMDYRYPLSAFQAFAICLSSFDTKLACE